MCTLKRELRLVGEGVDEDVGAEFEGVVVGVGLGVGVGELFPAVGEGEAGIDDDRNAVFDDGFEHGLLEAGGDGFGERGVGNLAEFEDVGKDGVVGGKGFELCAGEDFFDHGAEGAVEGLGAHGGFGEEDAAGVEVVGEAFLFFVGEVEFAEAGHVEDGLLEDVEVVEGDDFAFELDVEGGVFVDEFEEGGEAVGGGVPVAAVHQLGDDELVARGHVGLVVDLGDFEGAGVFVVGEDVGEHVGAEFEGVALVVERAAFDGLGVGVPAPGDIDGGIDDGGAAADVHAHEDVVAVGVFPWAVVLAEAAFRRCG